MKKILIFLGSIGTCLMLIFVVNLNAYELKQEESDLYNDKLYELNLKNTLLANEIEDAIKEVNGGLYPSYFGGIYLNNGVKNVVLQIVKNNLTEIIFCF